MWFPPLETDGVASGRQRGGTVGVRGLPPPPVAAGSVWRAFQGESPPPAADPDADEGIAEVDETIIVVGERYPDLKMENLFPDWVGTRPGGTLPVLGGPGGGGGNAGGPAPSTPREASPSPWDWLFGPEADEGSDGGLPTPPGRPGGDEGDARPPQDPVDEDDGWFPDISLPSLDDVKRTAEDLADRASKSVKDLSDWFLESPDGGGGAAFPPLPKRPPEHEKGKARGCSDVDHARLHKQVSAFCRTGSRTCNERNVDWMHDYPSIDDRCGEIRRRVRQNRDCLLARKEVADVCYGGSLDDGHLTQWDDTVTSHRDCLAALQIHGCI